MNPTFYFVLALTAFFAAKANGAAVLDTDGDVIFHGSYYVLPVVRGKGGGLILDSRQGQLCPLDVVQESLEVKEGLPVKFSNWRSRVGFVPESEDLNIETVAKGTYCFESTYWQIGDFDDGRNQFFVVAGSKPQYSIKTFFKIVKAGDNAYKFLFCPGKMVCQNVGIFIDENGVRRLALSSKPFLVMFKKANVIELSANTM